MIFGKPFIYLLLKDISMDSSLLILKCRGKKKNSTKDTAGMTIPVLYHRIRMADMENRVTDGGTDS